MNVGVLLNLLENVRTTGDRSWRADCPNGHTKARGSLAVTESDDGRVLLHCFACGDTPGILAVLGLELAALFPEPIRDPSPEARQRAREAFKRSAWSAALGVLSREVTVLAVAAHDLARGETLKPPDLERLALARERIEAARTVLS